MKKFLVVYYSRTGVSKKAANSIYERLSGDAEGDIEEIVDLKDRGGFLGAVGSVKDALSENITKIDTIHKLPSGYLEIIVVTPVWCGTVADAVRTYLAAYKSDIRSFKLVVCGGSDAEKQTAQIQKYILRAFALKAKTVVALRKKNVLSGNIELEIKRLTGGNETKEDGIADSDTLANAAPEIKTQKRDGGQ